MLQLSKEFVAYCAERLVVEEVEGEEFAVKRDFCFYLTVFRVIVMVEDLESEYWDDLCLVVFHHFFLFVTHCSQNYHY